MPHSTASISGPGTTIDDVRYISSIEMEVDVVYWAAASDSTQTLTVTNPDGLSDSESYTVGTLVFPVNPQEATEDLIEDIQGMGLPKHTDSVRLAPVQSLPHSTISEPALSEVK